MKVIRATCTIVLMFCLAGVAFADDLTTVGDPKSLGFSAPRLERITSWFAAHSTTGDPSGFVVAIARDGKLAYLQATGFEDQDKKFRCGRTRSFESDRCPSRSPASLH